MKRLALKLGLPTVALLATAVAALAFYSTAGAGSGSGTTGSFTAATISAPSSSTGTHTITWTQQAGVSDSTKNSQITYRVQRKLGAGSYANVASGPCSGDLPRPTTSCEDTVATAGSYTYRVVAKYGGWTATSNEAGPVVVTIATGPAAPTSVSLANGGGIGNAYINDANKASLNVTVGLGSSSLATDTVHVTITDGTNTTADKTAAATVGAGSVTVTGINASSLADGSVTIRATSSNATGTSAAKDSSPVAKDTVKPTSSASTVANITSGTTFTVPYTAADTTPSSAFDKVELYVDAPGGRPGVFSLEATDTTPAASGRSFSYAGATADGSYDFYTLAYDKAGNAETTKTTADKSATRTTTPPTVGGAVIAKTEGLPNSTAGFLRALAASPGSYRIYANATAGANPVATVTANTTNVPGGSSSVALSACTTNCTVNGVTYGYVSAQQTGGTASAGSVGFAVTATDTAGQSGTLGDTTSTSTLKVTIDNTPPQIASIATTDVGGASASAGTASLGDRVTFTYTEAIDGISLLSSWNWPWTATANVQVVLADNATAGGNDALTIKSADGATTLPFGTIDLGGTAYVSGGDAVFGATGTASTIARAGTSSQSIVVTLGTKSGAGTPASVNKTVVSWTPGSGTAAYDAAGNKLGTSPASVSTSNVKQF